MFLILRQPRIKAAGYIFNKITPHGDFIMRIGDHDEKWARTKRLGPPPNYSSRSLQIRLFTTVALLMLVVAAAMEARNPQRWEWLWKLDETFNEEKVDPRLRIDDLPRREGVSAAPGEVLLGGEQARPADAGESIEEEGLSAGDRAWNEGWKDIFTALENKERTQLYEWLKLARDGKIAEGEINSDDSALLDKLSEAWLHYRTQATEAVQGLGEQERAVWIPVLQQVELHWSVETWPALQAVARHQPLSEANRVSLARLQDLLDVQQLRAVQDNTVWRPVEREIWFRLFGRLASMTPEQIQRDSVGFVPYVKLFKSSKEYRGKFVTVRGKAEAVYSMPAPENTYGIKEYWIYWIRPVGNANSPIVVYALRKPEKFPSQDFADVGKKPLASKEDVEFHGIYFKKYAYQGAGGLYTAPTLLAAEPVWIIAPPDHMKQLPSPAVFGAVCAVLAVVAGLFAWRVYMQFHPGRNKGPTP